MAKVSVIVPIYNVEKYIAKCLESVISQTLTDIEIICVDDGSTDKSGSIADEYGKIDSRIKVIHKKNEGYGKAVNLGIDAAAGEYIGIVESDDFVEKDMYQSLYKTAEENALDYVKSGYYEYNNGERKIHRNSLECDYNTVYSEYENMNKLFLTKSIWSGLYRKSFLVGKGIRLLESAGASYQDTGFWFKVCISADRGMLIKDAFVNYRLDNDNSSVKSAQKVFCICDEIEECRRYLENSGIRKDVVYPYFYKYMYHCYQWNSGRIAEAYVEEFLVQTSGMMKEAAKALETKKEMFTPSEWESIAAWAEAPGIYCKIVLNHRVMQCNTDFYEGLLRKYISGTHLYIYGAGKLGKWLEIIVHKLNSECRVEFLVSDSSDNQGNVFSIYDSDIDKRSGVIIAVKDLKERLEMRKNAVEAGFQDIFVWDAGMEYTCRRLGRT